MRIVLDTNVLARARTGPHGPAGEVLRLVVNDHILIVSPSLLAELGRVLRYPRMRALHGADDAAIDAYVADVQSAADTVVPGGRLDQPIVTADPDDDDIIAAGVAGAANVICTRDRHLLHREVRAKCLKLGIRVLTDLELLDELRQIHDERGDT